jgi:hypothetical protein
VDATAVSLTLRLTEAEKAQREKGKQDIRQKGRVLMSADSLPPLTDFYHRSQMVVRENMHKSKNILLEIFEKLQHKHGISADL